MASLTLSRPIRHPHQVTSHFFQAANSCVNSIPFQTNSFHLHNLSRFHFCIRSFSAFSTTSFLGSRNDPPQILTKPPYKIIKTKTSLHHPSDIHKMSGEELTSYLAVSHDRIFKHNEKWAEAQKASDPNFFDKLAAGQNPEYLWISCSDSRIPAEVISGLGPGEAFIHRNIANLVLAIDLNAMSVLEYAVNHLHVKHIVVCGHYGCGGVKAAMTPKNLGILNPWLRNIRDVYRLYESELDAITDETARYNRLVELNVYEQCRSIIKVASVQEQYATNKYPIVHGWVFGLTDGRLTDLKVDHEKILGDIQKIYTLRG